MTQRLAALSYCAMGSPSLVNSQGTPKPVHSVLPAAGPYTAVPVLLSNTANEVLTHCTNWVAPTAPFVSGGAALTVKAPWGPTKPLPTPSKPRPAVVATAGPADD